MRDLFSKRITVANVSTLVKVAFLGVLSAEAYYFGLALGRPINAYLESQNFSEGAILLLIIGSSVFVLLYTFLRGMLLKLGRIVGSLRVDVFLLFALGILISLSFHGIGTEAYSKIISILDIEQLLLLLLLPIVFGFMLIFRGLQTEFFIRKGSNSAAFFINDIACKSRTDDLLGLSEKAEKFSELVLNGGSRDSIVFGIDAPWGIGKSSFINLCKEYWQERHSDNVIVYSFEPLRYGDSENLLHKFIDGLVDAIKGQEFVPELRPVVSRYSRFIKGEKGKFSFLGIELEFSPGTYTIDDAFGDLESVLASLEKKVVVVVDDLDRLPLSSIKSILFAIKKGFILPNVSYILCYDTENIKTLEQKDYSPEKLTEFFEKFINIKISLFLESEALVAYLSKNLDRALIGNSLADPKLVLKAMGGLIDIYRSADYHQYLPYAGDVRKIKRLINILTLLEIEKTDFDESDFNKQDLIHLLLIYINYPQIFRKIYNAETDGKRGFFSALSPYDADREYVPGDIDKKDYENSELYLDYIKTLEKDEVFLLNKVFNVKERFKKAGIDSLNASEVSTEVRASLACFNGGGWAGNSGRNLEEYLNLIVKLAKPERITQHKSFLNRKNEIRDEERSIQDILTTKEFSFSVSEQPREQLWRVIVNSLSEFNKAKGKKLIDYIVQNITDYSALSHEVGLGFRDDLSLFLVRLLDQVGWEDENGEHVDNSKDENLKEIAEWIFGEGEHIDDGIIDSLGSEARGVLGLNDLIHFRLFCSADRGGENYNLQCSLSKHEDINAPTTGSTKTIAIEEMREISQKVFSLFSEQYITTGKNIFGLIDSLSLEDLLGKYKSYLDARLLSGEVVSSDLDKSIKRLKSKLKSFIIYQLGNQLINLGVGCGYYNVSGKETEENKGGIRIKMNDYLFDVCFNPTLGEINYVHFVDYLLINFASTFDRGGNKWKPSINEFTVVLDRERLKRYWLDNKVQIQTLGLTNLDKLVESSNYTASYKEDLPLVYEVLDKFTVETVAEV